MIIRFEWRGEKGLREASEACGLSAATLSRTERGEMPDLATFVKLVDATGVDTEFALSLVRAQLPSAPEATVIADA